MITNGLSSMPSAVLPPMQPDGQPHQDEVTNKLDAAVNALQARELLEPLLLLSAGYLAIPFLLGQLRLLLTPLLILLGGCFARQRKADMIYHKDSRDIRTAWQGQMTESLEAGETLTLELGVSSRVLDNMDALVALDALSERSMLITPRLLIGGDGVAWAAGMNASARVASGQSAGLAPLYAGADVATYMATLATLPGPSAHTRHHRATGLPVGLHALLLTETQPGITPLWSFLPFVIGTQTQSSATSAEVATASIDQAKEQVLPWLALLVVIGLIVSALFV